MSDIKQRFKTIRKSLSQIHTKFDAEKSYMLDHPNRVEVWGLPQNLQSYEVKDMIVEGWIQEGLNSMESFLSKQTFDGMVFGGFEVKYDDDCITIWVYNTGKRFLAFSVTESGAMSFWGGRRGGSVGTLSKEEAVALFSH